MKTFITIAALAVFLASLVEGRVGNTELLRELLRERYGELEEPAARRNSERGYGPPPYASDSFFKTQQWDREGNGPDVQSDTDGENNILCEILSQLGPVRSMLSNIVLHVEQAVSGNFLQPDDETTTPPPVAQRETDDGCSSEEIFEYIAEIGAAAEEIEQALESLNPDDDANALQPDDDTGFTPEGGLDETVTIATEDFAETPSPTIEAPESPESPEADGAERELAKELLVRELYNMLKVKRGYNTGR